MKSQLKSCLTNVSSVMTILGFLKEIEVSYTCFIGKVSLLRYVVRAPFKI